MAAWGEQNCQSFRKAERALKPTGCCHLPPPRHLPPRPPDYLGPLIVTPEMVAKKIKAMEDNKLPGVDGISPKLPMETVEQISIPLARVFNLLKEGVVPFE